ncbi:hypothetical protein FRB94_013814 [Tulasnella sp. JGI-2019a]|nr:hypothetical protein FRB94_013814 [Tulasnella sp. JGI-2019a]KAG9010140.1 hypothetical protein FRB93_004802 [Tulasnella sp. JGI-2019a]KAG9035283.1 hypothetical protein FRB95_011578 [Tulasnella sp. JGI-2019a]
MHFTRSIVALVAATGAALVSAQTTHNVTVGVGGLVFTPNQITAAVGDTLSFEFHPANHTLTQSTFAAPCSSMAGGVDSGFMPVAATATAFPVYSFMIKEVTPLWFYCAQKGHCTQGMVFAVNVNASSPNSFNAFLTNAKSGAASSSAGTSASASSAAGAANTATGAAAAATTSAATTGAAAASGARESKVVSAGLSILALVLAGTALM